MTTRRSPFLPTPSTPRHANVVLRQTNTGAAALNVQIVALAPKTSYHFTHVMKNLMRNRRRLRRRRPSKSLLQKCSGSRRAFRPTGTAPEKMPQSGPSARTPRTRRRRPVALTKPAWGHCRPKQNSTFTGCAGVNGTTDPSKVHTINFALLLSFCHRAASYLDPLAQTSKQLRRHC